MSIPLDPRNTLSILNIELTQGGGGGGGREERLEGSSTVLEDAFRCSLIRIGGKEEEGRVVARSRPARRGNNYSDVDRGRVTRALMLADRVYVCVCVCVCASRRVATAGGKRNGGDRSRGSIASRL